jgi:pimeloyl-ACP methyl ester carboxylesterase
MPDINLGDVTIHYEEVGAGPLAYVFCHGLDKEKNEFGGEMIGQLDYWRIQFGRALTWDNRGLGKSSAATEYSLHLYASDLARLLKLRKIKKVVLHGVSWGGIVGLQFALDYPELCAAIIIDSSSSQVNEVGANRWYDQSEADHLGSTDSRSFLPIHRDSFAASARLVADLWEKPLTPYLHQIKCPSLIIAGIQDATTGGAGGSVIMSRNILGSELKIYEDAGHGIYRYKPKDFKNLVIKFCREKRIIPFK